MITKEQYNQFALTMYQNFKYTLNIYKCRLCVNINRISSQSIKKNLT